MMYKWGLNHFGLLGIFMAGIFVCAGAMRLARFNVLSRRDQASGKVKPGKYMLGLPIPAAASVLVFMVIVSHNAGSYQLVSEGSTALIVLVLSTLMVSRVRFRSFKELRLNFKTVGILLLVVGACVAIVMAGLEKAFIFLFLVLSYVVLGLAEEVIFFRRRRAQERSELRAPAPDPAPAQEEDVLRELGAFDGEDDEPDPVKDPITGPHHA
jgi:CDP-diacylglycerol--serine O-phosphatidyltransferase